MVRAERSRLPSVPMKRIMLGVPCFAESRELLESSLRSFMEPEVDVVAVDNGGSLVVKAVLGELEPLITVLRNPENVYVNPAWNQLAAHFLASESEILLLANADLIAAPNWSASLLMRCDRARAAGDREYWLGRALSAEAESLAPQTPSVETVEHSAGGSVSGAFFAMTQEAASIAFPIPPELRIHCGDDWVHLLLAEAGFRQRILRDMAVWHKGFVSGSRLPEFAAVIDRDRVLWDSRFSKVCKSLGEIERQYVSNRDAPSDINEHIPVLSRYAAGCESVTELGAGRSTWGLLHGRPKRLRSYDIRDADMDQQRRVGRRRRDRLRVPPGQLAVDRHRRDRPPVHRHDPQLRAPPAGAGPARAEDAQAHRDARHGDLRDPRRGGSGSRPLAGGRGVPRGQPGLADREPPAQQQRAHRAGARPRREAAAHARVGVLPAGRPTSSTRTRTSDGSTSSPRAGYRSSSSSTSGSWTSPPPRSGRTSASCRRTWTDLWSFSLANGRELKLPSHRDKAKDTRDFLLFINAKIDLLGVACGAGRAVDPLRVDRLRHHEGRQGPRALPRPAR